MTAPSAPNSPVPFTFFQESQPSTEETSVIGPPSPDGGDMDAEAPSLFGGMLPFLAMGAVLYFVLFAPEKKARKKRQAMLDAIKKGDKVVTTSGLHAEVVAVREHEIDLSAGGSRFTYSRAAVNETLD